MTCFSKICLSLLFFFLGCSQLNSDEYNTKDSGGWQDDVWDEIEVMPLEFAQNENDLVFNIHEGHTIELPEEDTIVINGNNLEFNVYGEFIVNGHIELAGNNTTLIINGFLTVDGSINFDGNNGEIEGDGVIDGDGEITGNYDVGDIINNYLPIEIIDFSAVSKQNFVLIEWVTATEINNNFFTIKRSYNMKDWETIDYINGAGNSNQIIEYSYKDKSPINGLSYYRLKQTDYDGRYEYFGPIAVFFDADLGKVNELNIKGLYVNNSYKVGLQIINKTTLDASLIVSDTKGNLLLNKYISPSNYIQNIDVNFDSNYSNNIIVIKLYNSFSLDTKKLIVN